MRYIAPGNEQIVTVQVARCLSFYGARVVELVDTRDLGSRAAGVGVRVPPFAPNI